MQYTMGFIGCGNMGGALIKAAASVIGGKQIAICDHNQEKTQALAMQTGANVANARTVAANSRFVVLGVKPQAMQTAVMEIADVLRTKTDTVVVTMAAGISIADLRGYIGENLPVIRIMPNTPVQLGAGMVLYTCEGVSLQDEEAFLHAFSKAGVLDKLDEAFMDAAAALSGCGPAFVYAFAQALTKGAEDLGVPKDKAEKYTAQTLRGAAEMLLAYGDAESLKRAVCSPGGTTLAGLAAMENAQFMQAAQCGVTAAYERTKQLKK